MLNESLTGILKYASKELLTPCDRYFWLIRDSRILTFWQAIEKEKNTKICLRGQRNENIFNFHETTIKLT